MIFQRKLGMGQFAFGFFFCLMATSAFAANGEVREIQSPEVKACLNRLKEAHSNDAKAAEKCLSLAKGGSGPVANPTAKKVTCTRSFDHQSVLCDGEYYVRDRTGKITQTVDKDLYQFSGGGVEQSGGSQDSPSGSGDEYVRPGK